MLNARGKFGNFEGNLATDEAFDREEYDTHNAH
jgi:hypothetical protein